MTDRKTKNDRKYKVQIGLPEGEEWSAEKLAAVKAHAKQVAASRSPEQVMRNRYLSVKYRMEAYAATNEQEIRKTIPLETFLKEYLDVLNIPFRKFAVAIDMNDSNLKKYLSGERKFNADLARRFGRFFHTSPVTWMKVYQLNDLVELLKEPEAKEYKKYDVVKLAEQLGSGQLPGIFTNDRNKQVTGSDKHQVGKGRYSAVKGKGMNVKK